MKVRPTPFVLCSSSLRAIERATNSHWLGLVEHPKKCTRGGEMEALCWRNEQNTKPETIANKCHVLPPRPFYREDTSFVDEFRETEGIPLMVFALPPLRR